MKYIPFTKIKLKYLYFTFFIIIFYMTCIEPNIITQQYTQIHTGFQKKIVVISDLHLGIFKGPHFLERVVTKINTIPDIDFVVIPGDFTYVFGENHDFEDIFSPLKKLNIPIYATLGNHDTQNPGPNIEKQLIQGLQKNNVIVLNNQIIHLSNLTLVGLGDFWNNNDQVELLKNIPQHDNTIVLAHNPDTISKYTTHIPDITISGHTHGGQIKIPFLYKYIIPCIGDFDEGFYQKDNIKGFISSGLGEVQLPMRLFNPPVIDILELN